MVAYDGSVNVVFLGGADFEPPSRLEDTDRSRYVKLRTLEEAKAPAVSDWIEQAGRVPGWQRGSRGRGATTGCGGRFAVRAAAKCLGHGEHSKVHAGSAACASPFE